MFVWRIWSVLCVFGFVSLNGVDHDCAENYDNEIPLDEQEEDTPSVVGICQDDTSRWDKLFTVLEDSHMRQNMLLSSVEQCCSSLAPLKMPLSKGPCHQCANNMDKICKAQAEQIHLNLKKDLEEIMHYSIENEKNINITLEQLLFRTHETNVRLKRLEDAQRVQKPHPTLWPFGTASTILSSTNGRKEQDTNQLQDMGSIGKALVAIATELQKVQVQLSKVIEETRRKD